MKRAVLKRLTSLVACLLVVAIVSPNFVYSVKASAHEGNAGVEIEAPESKETESEKAKETKADSDKKTAKETKTVKETKADSEETKAKETEAKETEAKATEAKAADKSEETKVSETDQAKESEKAEPSETEKPAETSAESKETVPSETAEETKPSESAEPSESSESSETKEEPQPSESVPAESSETSESSEETEPSETSESSAAETATAASIKVAEDAEEFIKFVASLPEQYRLIIDTDKDLSSLKGAKGVFYDGSYVLVFDGIDNYDAALKYLNSKKISFSIDGSVELCGVTIKCNNVTVNPNAKTKIAIIDTGSSLANEKVSVMGDKGEDKNGHGTSMASAVLAQSDDAYIISIKAIDDDGTGKVADVYAALQYAIDADCKVVLMAISLRDLGQYDAFKTLVADAVSKGIKVVASAGNNGTDASKYIPAGLKGVLTAGAMDENGVKLSKSNYGKCVDYYVVADSTSEAAAILAGKVIAGKTDDLATTCKMSASEGKDDARAKFKVNRSDDPGSNDFSSNNGETLYNNAAAFCIFTKEFIHSNHMEGSVAADKYTRKTDSIMEITPRIFPYTYDANYYFYFNSINQDPVDQKMISQSPDEGKPYASMYLGPDLVYVEPEKTVDGNYQITVDNQTIAVPNDLANNGNGRFIYSYSQKKIVGSGNNPTTISGGGTVKASSKIDFDSVLTKIGNWAKDFYDKHDLKLSDYTPNGYEYTIQLHDGVNYINLTEDQLNKYGFDFVPSSSGKCSIVINVVDDGDGIVNLSHDEANKRVTYNKIGIPEATKESLTAASHILFNFHKDIHTVNLGKSTTTELGTLLAPGADLTIASTHDGNAIAKSFKNYSVEIHQAAFPFVGKNASSTGKVTIKKTFTHPGDEDLGANTVFKIYEGNYRSVDELKGATGTAMTRSGNTYTASMTVAGPYTIRETTTPDNYNGLGSTLIHITLKADGSVELDSPKSATNITVDSASTEKNLTLKVENSRKKASTAGSVSLKKIFTGFFPMDARSATFKVYYGKFTDINKLDDSALVPGCEKTFTYNDTVNFTGLDEVGPYTIVETGVSANIEKVDLIYLNVAEDGKVTFDNVPTGVKVTTNNSTSAAIEVENKKKAPVTVTVSFSKKDMTGEGSELAGAKMELSAGIGTMVNWNTAYVSGPAITVAGQKATWTSGSEQLKIKLPAGTYTLKETTAPDGYDIITTTTFTVDASGKITKTTSNTDVTIEGNVVTAFDAAKKTYEVSISKKDITKTGSELAGASMKLTATGDTSVNWNKARKSGPAITANGKAITWTSGTAPLVLNLPDGTYQLEETATLKIGGKEYTRFTTATFSMTNGVVTETTVKDDSTVTFTGTDNRTVTAFDTPVTKTADVNFSKKDFADKSVANANELTGAEMKLTATEGDATTWTADDWAAAKKEGPAVTMVSGEKAVTWTSTSTQLKISLPDGKYTLTENAAPAGYEKITEFKFEISNGKVVNKTATEVTADGTTNTVTAFDKLTVCEVSISKKDIVDENNANAKELAGAKMTLTANSGVAASWTSDQWKAARKSGPAITVSGATVTWTSGGSDLKINLPDGQYTLVEDTAPDGYGKITAFEFTVSNGKVVSKETKEVTADGNTNTVTAFDTLKTSTVTFSKKDFADKEKDNAEELAGAKMKLTAVSGPATSWDSNRWKSAKTQGPAVSKVDGESAATWISGSVQLKLSLPDGTYKLEETTPPTDYSVITEITFTIKDGKVENKSNETVTVNGSNNVVTAFDKAKETPTPTPATVYISKKDMADKGKVNANELSGAKMKLTAVSGDATTWDADDWNDAQADGPDVNKVNGASAIEWTSGTKQLKINLPDGQYTLSEDKAPNGYNVITELTFEIKDGKVVSSSNTSVTADGDTNTVTAFDELKKVADVVFSKKDFSNKGKENANELTGATLKLTAVSGDAASWTAEDWTKAKKEGPAVSKVSGENAVTWTSATTQLKLSLPDGKYTLTENAAPAGYDKITEFSFEIKDGKVTSTATSETVTLDNTTNTVTAFDKITTCKTAISKKDMADKGKENASELSGAAMKLTATEGKAVSWTEEQWKAARVSGPAISVSGAEISWTSGTEQLMINLPDGKYTLSETTPPSKYVAITDMTFEIKDGKVVNATSETVTADAATNTVTAFDKAESTPTPAPADVVFSKKDFADKNKDNAEELTGATLKLTAVSGDAAKWTAEDWTKAKKEGPSVSKVTGENAVTWTSSSTQLKIGLPDGTYKLEENGAPAGYDEITAITFTVENGKVTGTSSETVTLDGTKNVVTAFDKATKTYETAFSKKDFADKNKDNAEELPGASMKLTATEGKAASWTEELWKAARVSGPAISVSGASITWTSGNAQLLINLPDGKYTLSETTPPSTHTAITDIEFEIKGGKVTGTSSETVTLDGTKNVVTAFDKAKDTPTPTPADIVFSKKDFADKGNENADELTGATLKLTAVSGDASKWTAEDWTKAQKDGPSVSKVTGENAVTWTSETTQLKIALPDGTYTLEEDGTPAGYEEITKITFTIENGKVKGTSTETVSLDGTKNVITAFDKLRITDIAFSKKDFADKGKDNAKELVGATMKLTAKSGAATNWSGDDWDDAKTHGPMIKMVTGEKAVTWTSSSEQLLIGLPDGEYELEEKAAPNNYGVITKLQFKIVEGKVSAVGTTDETTSIDDTNKVITAFDKATTVTGDVSISKKDMADKDKTNANELSGATMQLTAVSGDAANWTAEDWTKAQKDGPSVSKVTDANAITWTSGTTALKISLPDGKYELKENLAPAGYKVITTTTFELKDGKVVTSKSATVEADGNTNTVTAFDELRITDIAFSKKDFTDKGKDNADELTGAKMKLTAVSGPATKWSNADWVAAQKEGPVFSKDSNEAAIEWISATTQFKIGLPDGDYKLSETQSPDDKYDLITTLNFTIKNGEVTGKTDETTVIDDTNKVITGFDKELTPPAPDSSKVTFSKQDMTQKGKELPNAYMKLSTTDDKIDFSTLTHSGGSDVTVSGDKKSISWKTTKDNQFAVWLPDGTYTLEETVAPNGYNVITKTTFTVKNGKVDSTESTTHVDIDGVNNIITAFDEAKTFEIELSKEDIAKNLIADAVLSITSVDGYDLSKVEVTQGGASVATTLKNGNTTIEFKSSGSAYSKIKGLRVGKYVLTETTAPAKYKVAASIDFEIDNDGALICASVVGSRIVMIDRADPSYFTPVTLNGQDKEDKKDLPDIVITITSTTPTVDLENVKVTGGVPEQQGEKIIRIKTTGGPVELSLPDGEYVIKQISGPDGYEKVPSAPFKVEGGKIVPTGTPVNIDIEDHNITVLLPKTNSGKKTPKGGSVPATGVGVSYTNVAGAALISAAVAAMGICIVVFKKKKQEEI